MDSRQRRALLGGLLVAAPAVTNAVLTMVNRRPEPALAGEQGAFPWDYGTVRYTTAGEGEPLLLVHGVYAGASSFEWRLCFEALSRSFRVYAVDLLGFGLSDKPAAPYSAQLYARLLEEFSAGVIGQPAHVLASSLGSAFAVSAQAMKPIARSMALICPAGIDRLARREQSAFGAASLLLELPIYGKSLYYSICSRQGIEYYMRKQVYVDPARATEEVIRYHYQVAHTPGAFHAARAFITGRLNVDIRQAFAGLDIPVMLLWGRQARMAPVMDANAFLTANPRAELRLFEQSGLMPHDEEAEAVVGAVTEFFQSAPTARQTEPAFS